MIMVINLLMPKQLKHLNDEHNLSFKMLNWNVLLGVAGAFILGYILYFVFFKEEDEKNDDEKKEPLDSGIQQKIA